MLLRFTNILALPTLLAVLCGCPGGKQEVRCEGDCSGEDVAEVWVAGRCPENDCPFIPAEADQNAKNGAKMAADNDCILNNLNTNCACSGTHQRQNPTCEDFVQEESGNVWCIVKVKYSYSGTCGGQ